MDCNLLVLSAGASAYSAAFCTPVLDLGLKVVTVKCHASLGGVWLNMNCLSSKALLHVAAHLLFTSAVRRGSPSQ